jgi:hypothetical protein
MSNVISINEKRINNIIDKTYLFLNNVTIEYDIDNDVYFDEYYIFCKNIYNFMIENNINKNFYEVIDFVICNVISDIIANKKGVNIKNFINYVSIYLKINFYKLCINPINDLKIMCLRTKILKEIIKLPERKNIQYKKG